jgi:hypothetical protein
MRAKLAGLACALLAGCGGAFVAAGPEIVDDAGEADAGVEAALEAAAEAEAPLPDAGAAATCDAGPGWNLAGCLCATAGLVRDCWLGDPGPKSACRQGGTQQCEGTGSGARWGACSGAVAPRAETCFDGVDDDCNGTVDQGCRCTDDVDMCRPSDAGFTKPFDVFVVPAQPRAGQPFDLYVLSKSSLASTTINVGGNHCAGTSLRVACPSAGAGCAGWNVVRHRPTIASAGTYVLYVYVNDDGAPCDVPPTTSLSIKVVP